MPAATAMNKPNRSEARITSMCCPRARCHAAIPMMTAAPASNAPTRMCGYATTATGLVNTAQMSVSSARPDSALTVKPTGFCIHELAARMKYADRFVPMATHQIHAR